MKSDVAEVGDAERELVATLSVLLTTGNTTKFTRDTDCCAFEENDILGINQQQHEK